jgi:hypothetical protein
MSKTFKKYFTLEHRILLNSKLFKLDNFEKRCLELEEKKLIDFKEITDLESIKRKKIDEKDFFKLCSNYEVKNKEYKEVLFTLLPKDSFLEDLENNKQINLFKSLIFHKFPSYACIKFENEKNLPYFDLEEIHIIKLLQNLDGVRKISPYNDIQFTTLLISSLYINAENENEYKHYIRKWFEVKQLPLPKFVLKQGLDYNKLLYLFFENWVRFFLDSKKNNINLKSVPMLKILDNSLFQISNLEINRDGDQIEVVLKKNKPRLELLNNYLFVNNIYYFFYKSNFPFLIYVYSNNENIKTDLCDNSNIFKFSPNNEKQELRIKISSSEKIKSDLIIGSNEFSLNE